MSIGQEGNKNVIDPRTSVVLSIDVEDYFMSPESISFEEWESYPSYIHQGMESCLSLLKEYNAKATFFFVAWLAERYPELVQQTAEAGHEIGTHTYNHTFVSTLGAEEFERSIKKSLEILQPLVPNQPILGHRAPAFSLDANKKWQFDILRSHNLVYDSSVIPVQNYLYGDNDAPRHPYWLHDMVELPPAVISLGGKRLAVGGGGTLRLYPSFYLRWARKRYQSEGYPPVIYMHPWEFIPDHPKLNLPFKQRWMHWVGIQSVESKMRTILRENNTFTCAEYYQQIKNNHLNR